MSTTDKTSSTTDKTSLATLGWQPYFQQQLTLSELEACTIARVMAHHRSGFDLAAEIGPLTLAPHKSLPAMTVGDWVLLNQDGSFVRLLERHSLFRRKAAGTQVAEQYIAANIDTLFIVCSLNQDFNLSRIERYLALANEAGVEPVVVLTKADLCDDSLDKLEQVRQLDPFLMAETVNALDPDSSSVLFNWCKAGKTVAFLGSSGVGKSTLVNTLTHSHEQKTQSIREDDSKGRHTTTARSVHFLPGGGLLVDTPGMRELQLAYCEQGVHETFAEIEQLATQCRFADCQHESEPGCAVQAALASGELDQRRLHNYHKLLREQARNSATLAERHEQSRRFGKMVKSVGSEARMRKKGY